MEITSGNTEFKYNRPILLIEDNLMDVNLIKRTANKISPDIRFVVLNDGEMAFDFIQSNQNSQYIDFPAFVILDLRLPFYDGLEVLKLARNIEQWKKIPFIIFSTSSQYADVKKAFDLGANSFVVKPIDFVDFAETIKQIITYWYNFNISELVSEDTNL